MLAKGLFVTRLLCCDLQAGLAQNPSTMFFGPEMLTCWIVLAPAIVNRSGLARVLATGQVGKGYCKQVRLARVIAASSMITWVAAAMFESSDIARLAQASRSAHNSVFPFGGDTRRCRSSVACTIKVVWYCRAF